LERPQLPAVIRLVDRSRDLVDAWREVFEGFDAVEAVLGDFFASDADCMLSPANSFGIMDGGLDLAIREQLGFEVETRVQREIIKSFHGECPVGSAFVVETGHSRWPTLACAPTMRVPESVPHSLNAFLAFRAALNAIARYNRDAARPIKSLVAPGLCTGIGQMSPRRCAGQMRVAYVQASKPARIPSYDEIHRVHLALRTAG
jgi:O-acetyl-ADP-ribose deacetylase (regulator of RNase III)